MSKLPIAFLFLGLTLYLIFHYAVPYFTRPPFEVICRGYYDYKTDTINDIQLIYKGENPTRGYFRIYLENIKEEGMFKQTSKEYEVFSYADNDIQPGEIIHIYPAIPKTCDSVSDTCLSGFKPSEYNLEFCKDGACNKIFHGKKHKILEKKAGKINTGCKSDDDVCISGFASQLDNPVDAFGICDSVKKADMCYWYIADKYRHFSNRLARLACSFTYNPFIGDSCSVYADPSMCWSISEGASKEEKLAASDFCYKAVSSMRSIIDPQDGKSFCSKIYDQPMRKECISDALNQTKGTIQDVYNRQRLIYFLSQVNEDD